MDNQKHVLLITYYWPPSGGAGVHRWLRFSKYFGGENVHLTVYCPENAAWPVIDEALEAEVPADITVIRNKIFEPHKYLSNSKNAGVGFTQEKDPTMAQKTMIWIRGNLFIPDSRVFWIKPSIRFLSHYLKKHPEITTIISTGPPHSTHLIALGLKEKFHLKWVADFRDPWTQIDFYEQLSTGARADAKHKRLEKACLQQADEVVTVSRSCAEGLTEISGRPVHVITNGYEFPDFDPSSVSLDASFTVSHFGSMPQARNPEALWIALKEMITEGHPIRDFIKVRLIGTVDYQVLESVKKHGLDTYIEVISAIPHSESLELQRKSQILLLVANNTGNVKGILTGKFFEYLGAKRPILAIGSAGSDLENAVKETHCGAFIAFEEIENLKKILNDWFQLFQKGNLFTDASGPDKYRSSELAKSFIRLL